MTAGFPIKPTSLRLWLKQRHKKHTGQHNTNNIYVFIRTNPNKRRRDLWSKSTKNHMKIP
ncbi:hypothetical protein CHELA40_13223 [Chelatococcus asaccharovorans]|nr:hypothetical protein CHELA40_13223 [Chelatococcus asaccharovorans]CAH1679528.1 hypothetical protein CHELA17_62397 [Chelatococcus asaccharovorans]